MTRIASLAAIMAGAELPPLEVVIDREAIVRYAGAADDYVRQHWDHPYMIGEGYPDVIVHGWLTFAHMCRVVTDWAPPQAGIARYAVRYHRPMHPGLLRCGGTVASTDEGEAELALWAMDGAGTTVATATLRLAARPGR